MLLYSRRPGASGAAEKQQKGASRCEVLALSSLLPLWQSILLVLDTYSLAISASKYHTALATR
jgi:hypothetical protein